jgi:hypothetical protein
MKNEFTKLTKKIVYILPFFLLPFTMSGQWVFEITEPAEIAGIYPIALASFGNSDISETISANIAIGMDNSADPTLGCESLETDLTGTIGLLDRGECPFVEKAINAQAADAIALIICNTDNSIFTMTGGDQGDEVDIRTGMLRNNDCLAIKAALAEGDVTGDIYFNQVQPIWADGFEDPSAWLIDGPEGSGPNNGFSITDNSGPDITWFFDERINSTSGGNYALFQNGDPNDAGSVLRDGPHTLTYSEPIDLSGAEFPSLKFNQTGARFFELQAVEISVDGGDNWILIGSNDDIDPLTSGGGSAYSNPMTRLYDIYPFLEEGDDEILLRFFWDNSPDHPNPDLFFVSYGWLIDDVEIIETPATNVSAIDVFNPVFSFATPEAHIYADTFGFFLTIQNNGLDLDVVEANVEVRNATTNELLHSDFLSVENVLRGMDSTVFFDQNYGPDLPPGDYVINYRIDVPGSIDFDYSDNGESFAFRVTETTYAKDDPELVTFTGGTSQAEATWYWGNAYYIAPQDNTEAEAYFDGSQHAFLLNEGEEFTDESVLVHLLEYVPDGPIFDFSVINQDVNTVPDLHGAFTSIALASVNADKLNEAGVGNIFTLHYSDYLDPNSFEQIEEPIALQQDKLYFVIVQVEQDPNVANLRIATSSSVEYSVVTGLLWTQGRNWTGFTGDAVPIARMLTEVRNVSATDRFISENQFSVYPVPASSELFIDFELDQPTDMDIQLFDIQGKMMGSTSHTNVTSEVIPQDVTEYQTGNYIIRIVTENGVQSRQVLIVK